ncbi:MAG: hypothetical protein IPI87_01860 [Betaproteobacteria bacterium]|nr:hypothetical protein [Betaproteobacteria bacterium]
MLLSITAMGTEFLSAVATFERGIEGLWGVKRDRVMHDGQAAFVVRELAPWSLAPQSGLQIGDVHPRPLVRRRPPVRPGESIGGSIVRDGASLRAEVTTTPRPVERIEDCSSS